MIDEWKKQVDLGELQKRGVNFTENHIKSLWDFLENTFPSDLQESIDGLVYDIDHGHIKAIKGPLNLLIGVIRKGELYTFSPLCQRGL